MNNSDSSDTRQLVFDIYLVALEKTFGNEPWIDIEKCAERVWMECCDEDDVDWESIKDRVQVAWEQWRTRQGADGAPDGGYHGILDTRSSI